MDQTPQENLFELQLDHDSSNQLREATKWSRFLAILYFVFIGFGVLCLAFGTQAIVKMISTSMPGFDSLAGVLVAIIIIALIFFTWTTILLYRFSNLTREGILRQDQELFNDGMKALKNYLTVYGIFTIIGLLGNVSTLIKSLIS
ncbi:MAG TPA: hypothetical protein VM012_01305 [Flavitalea sp.]|nr:hypothetical protein [Flavitalea sp.]